MVLPYRRLPLVCSWCRKVQRNFSSAATTEDKYNGITVDLSLLGSLSSEEFRNTLSDSLQRWRSEGRSAVWIRVPILMSHVIPEAAKHGFEFHHAEYGQSLLKLWLDDNNEDLTPQFATHQVGVSGMVIREDTGQVLAVQDKNSQFNLWKFPGGLSNLEEDIGDTAVREVFEETGIRSEFQSILAMRQQHKQPGAFGRSDIFIVCRLRPLTFDLKPCSREIKGCQWMDIADMQKHSNFSAFMNRLTGMAMYGVQHGFHELDITYEEMKSVYKGLQYKLYHRPIPTDKLYHRPIPTDTQTKA